MKEELKKKLEMDLESTDYDIEKIDKLDYRMEAGKKDALVFHGLGISAAIIATIWMYIFGSGNPTEMKYLLGMPIWISGAIIIYIIMLITGMTYLFLWDEFSLEARNK